MTNKTLDKANELHKEIGRVSYEIDRIEASFERKPNISERQREFPRISFWKKERISPSTNEKEDTVAYIFNVDTIHGIEVRLDEGLVKAILGYLKQELAGLEKEFEELGK